MSFSEGGGEPSTHPFHPFFAADLFLRGCESNPGFTSKSSSSSGVRGLFDDVREVLDELDGPGVEDGVDKKCIGDEPGGGVTETDRCMVAMWMAGRAAQKDEGPALGGITIGMVVVLAFGVALCPASPSFSRAFASAFARFLSSFFSLFLILRSSSSLSPSLYGPTPFSRLVSTSRFGGWSKTPAMTVVALRRTCLGGIEFTERTGIKNAI